MTLSLEHPSLENNSKDGWPIPVDMKVIDAGVVHYEDLRNATGESVGGNVLVQKETLDRMAASMEGKPIVNWDHRKVDPKEFGRGKFQGIITGAYFNSADGWYHAKGFVWDEATRRNIENGYSISCAYTVSEWGDGGTYHKVPYEKEVKNGAYTHIAVVPVPRYEGARIELLNSGGKTMNLMKLFGKGKEEAGIEVDTEKSVVAINGADVPVSELINSYQKQQTKVPMTLKDDDLIEVNGKKVSVLELRNAHLALKNAQEEEQKRKEDEEKKNADEEEEKKKLEAKNAADEEAKKAEEQKNADEAKKKEDEEKANALKNAAKLEEMRNKGGKVEMPKLSSLQDLMGEGESRYGSKKPVASAK